MSGDLDARIWALHRQGLSVRQIGKQLDVTATGSSAASPDARPADDDTDPDPWTDDEDNEGDEAAELVDLVPPLNVIDQAEVFPAHRYRMSSSARNRNRGYYDRLYRAAEAFGIELPKDKD